MTAAALSFKDCPDCGVEKDSSEFYAYRNGSLHRACKTCVGSARAAYYRANKDKVLEREAARRAKSDWAARCKEYRLKNWAKKLLQSAALCSRRRGHGPPSITEEWIYAQPLVCPYLNVALHPSTTARSPWAPSLDRIDNDKGYTPDNVRVTSWIWNLMRGPLSVDEALKAVEQIRAAG